MGTSTAAFSPKRHGCLGAYKLQRCKHDTYVHTLISLGQLYVSTSHRHPHLINAIHQILPQQELYPLFPDPILGPGEQ